MEENVPYSPAVLIVDDDMEVVDFLELCLKEKKCTVTVAYDGEAALRKTNTINFDLIILDVNLPSKNGLEVCKLLKSNNRTKYIPVIIVTGNEDSEIMTKCFNAGADEFLKKPLKPIEVLTRLKSMLRIKLMNDELSLNNTKMLEDINEKTREWQKVYMETIKSIADAVDKKYDYTHDRSNLIAEYSVAIAHEIQLGDEEIINIRQAAELHDIGRIVLNDEILEKKGKLSDKEWTEIKKHAVASAEMLQPMLLSDDVSEIVIYHHEKYDGTGYPALKKGDEIPIGSRIIAVVDAYESMTSERPHRKALSEREALLELKKNSGAQFDPKIVDAFFDVLGKLDLGVK